MGKWNPCQDEPE